MSFAGVQVVVECARFVSGAWRLEVPGCPIMGEGSREPLSDELCSTPVLVGCCVCATLVGIEYGIIVPTIFQYLSSLGARPQLMMGLACASFSLAKTVTFVPLGMMSDRVGARWPCVLFLCVASLGNLYYFMASRPWDVVFSRAIVGVGSSVTSVLMAVVGRSSEDLASRRVRDRRLAFFNATSLLAILVGPGLAACFSFARDDAGAAGRAAFTRYSGPGLVMCVLMGACAVWALVALPAAPGRRRTVTLGDLGPDARDPPARLLSGGGDGGGDGDGDGDGDCGGDCGDGSESKPEVPAGGRSPGGGGDGAGAAGAGALRKASPGRDAYATLVTRRGGTSLVVTFVAGAVISVLDTAFPIVSHSDFGLNPTEIAGILACYAACGVLAMAMSEYYRRLADSRGRRVAIVRFGTGVELVGGVMGFVSFSYLSSRPLVLGPLALGEGALLIWGTMSATGPQKGASLALPPRESVSDRVSQDTQSPYETLRRDEPPPRVGNLQDSGYS